jgi:hypothetical protein
MNDAPKDTLPPRQGVLTPDPINHPLYYGNKDDPYEAIKVIEAWDLGFALGNAVKYIARADKKGDALTDLKKAAWYVLREIANREGNRNGK